MTRLHAARPVRAVQRGTVLLFAMIALVIMLVSAVALMRSFQGSLFAAGNIAFKRDMQNQSERAVAQVMSTFAAGGSLSTSAARATNLAGGNYSAKLLAVDNHGIPTDLFLSDSSFAASYSAGDLSSSDNSLAIRYVVDRMCDVTGNEMSLGSANCMLAASPIPAGTSETNLMGADRGALCATCASAAPQGVVYRISVRVSGPRNTQSFFQSTFTVPSS